MTHRDSVMTAASDTITSALVNQAPYSNRFDFEPVFVIVDGGPASLTADGVVGKRYSCVFISPSEFAGGFGYEVPGYASVTQVAAWANNSMSWYIGTASTTSGRYDVGDSTNGPCFQLNRSGETYFYFAVGQ